MANYGYCKDFILWLCLLNIKLKEMKFKFLISAIAVCVSLNVQAQARPAFRSGYVRLGINNLGDELDSNLAAKENVFDNKYGAGTGY